jgi:exopolysaccharide biosynthesis protein
VSETGSTPLGPHTLVLVVSTNWMDKQFLPLPGITVRISLRMEPDLEEAVTALGGGPIMIQGGRQQVFGNKAPNPKLPNTIKHIWDQHPRSALGWNREAFFLVAVDGRMPGWSEGWKIPELAEFMRKELGCTEAINLDGGGSTSLWFDGELRNHPADGEERPVANALLVYP